MTYKTQIHSQPTRVVCFNTPLSNLARPCDREDIDRWLLPCLASLMCEPCTSPPSLFALSAALVTRHILLEGLDEEIGLRVELASRQLICVSPHCQNNPEEKKCGLCLLPLCNVCSAGAGSCDGCGVTVCQLCASPEEDEEAHAKHHKLWALAGGGRPVPSYCSRWPPPAHCHVIDCTTCGKTLCWYCWQALAVVDHNPDNAAWMCDACNSNQCLDCICVVDAVGLPKLAHSFEDVEVNVICHGCLKADRGRYRLTPNYNTNAFDEGGEDDDDYDSEEETALCGECGEYSSTELIFCPDCGT